MGIIAASAGVSSNELLMKKAGLPSERFLGSAMREESEPGLSYPQLGSDVWLLF